MALQNFLECKREEFYMINILYRLNGKKSYLLTSSYKTLYILEVHFEFFINEEQLDEVKCGFIARGAERRGQ